MPKTVQIRDIDDETYLALSRHAGQAGLSVPQLLQREIRRLASRPPLEAWLDLTRTRHSSATSDGVIADLDQLRGEWPTSPD